jgi:outer membrane protein TolC
MKFLIHTVLVFLISAFHVAGQKNWTLNECIDYAVQNNLNLKRSGQQNQINKESYNQSIRDLLPSAGLNAGSGLYFGKSVDPTTNDYVNRQFFSTDYSFGGSVGLFSGFSKINTISFNKLNYLAGLEANKQLKNKIAFQVLSNFFDVLFYHGLLDIANKQKELSELNLKRTKALVKAGLSAKGELLEMESRMAAEQLYVVQTTNSLNSAQLNLKQTMNYKGTDNFSLDENLIVSENERVPTEDSGIIFKQALKTNPQIKGEEFKTSAAAKNLSIARGRLMPNLSLSGGYSTRYASAKGDDNIIPLSEQFKNNASQSLSVSLQVPIFYNWNRRSNVTKAKLGLLQAQTDFDLVKQQLYQEIEKNVNELSSLSSEFEQTEIQLEASKIAFRAAEKKLEQGLIDAIDFYNSKNLMAQAESNVLRTKLQLELKKRTVDFFIGLPIYTENK